MGSQGWHPLCEDTADEQGAKKSAHSSDKQKATIHSSLYKHKCDFLWECFVAWGQAQIKGKVGFTQSWKLAGIKITERSDLKAALQWRAQAPG